MANGFRSQQINRSSFSDLLQLIQGSAEAGRRRQAEYRDIHKDFDTDITGTYDNEQLAQKKQQFDNYFNSNRGSMNEAVLAKYELLDAKFQQQQKDNDGYTLGIEKNKQIAKNVENALLSYSAINEDTELTADQKITKRKEAMDALGASIGDYLGDAGEFRTKHYNRLATSPQDAFYIDNLNELFAYGIAQAEDDFVFDSNEARAFSLALQTQSFEPIKSYKVNEMNLNSALNQKQIQQTDLLYKQYEISSDISKKASYYYELEEIAANENGDYSQEEQENAKNNLLSLENQSFYTDDDGNQYMYANLSDDESDESLLAAQQMLGKEQTFEQLKNIDTIYSKRVGQSYLQGINQIPSIKDDINTIFGIAKPVVQPEVKVKDGDKPKDEDKDDKKITDESLSSEFGIESIDIKKDIASVKTWAAPEITKTATKLNNIKLEIDNYVVSQTPEINPNALNKILDRENKTPITYNDLKDLEEMYNKDVKEMERLYNEELSMKKMGIKGNDQRRASIRKQINKLYYRWSNNMYRRGTEPTEEGEIKIGKVFKRPVPNSALSALRGGLARIKGKETQYNELKSKYDEDLKRTQK